jgi:hypothetical protein
MRTLLFYILCLSHFLINAQDTIYKRSGELIPAKVLEINTKEISYKRADLLDGPLFVINKNEIKKIKYVTGTIDSFKVVVVESKVTISKNDLYTQYTNQQILFGSRKGIYRYQNRSISDRKLFMMAQEKNMVWKDPNINYLINSSRQYKALQYITGNVGVVIGGIGLFGCLIATEANSNVNDNMITAMVAVASAAVIVSSQVVSVSFKLKRVKRADQVLELYNQYSKN